jgi:hypothetical protein
MPRKLKSTALRSDAVTVANIPNGEITAAKLHTTAIQDKLGYTPVSPTQLNNLIDGAPSALDTLNELAAALNDDANYAATVTTALGTKANSSDVTTALAAKLTKSGDTMTGDLTIQKSSPSILLNDTSDAGVDVAIGSMNENFYIYEPEDSGSPQVPGTLGKEWFRIDDDGDAYVYQRRIWDAGTAPSAAIRVVQNNSSTPLAIQNSNYNLIQHQITRTLTTSKVLVMTKWAWSADNPNGRWQIDRSYDNSNWTTITYIVSRDESGGANSGDANTECEIYMDSPSSSYLTVYYRLYWVHYTQNGGTMYIGRTFSNDIQGGGTFNRSITLMEIAS